MNCFPSNELYLTYMVLACLSLLYRYFHDMFGRPTFLGSTKTHPQKLGYAMPMTPSQQILILFIFHWEGRGSTQILSSLRFLYCTADSLENTSLIITIISSSSLRSTVISHRYPHMTYLLPPYRLLLQPHLVTLYPERFFRFVLDELY